MHSGLITRTPCPTFYSQKQFFLPLQSLATINLASISIILSFQECHFNISRTNRLPIISPAKMSLFKINKKLQSEVCNHEPYGSPPWPLPNPPSRELFFKNGKGSWEGDRKQCSLEEWRVWSRMASQWLSCGSLSLGKLLPGKKRKSSFFLWCMRASPSVFLTLF